MDGVFQQVDDIVDFMHQLINILAIKGCNETLVQQLDHIVSDLVSFMLYLPGFFPVLS